MQYEFVWQSFVAGIAASLACGLGVLPLLIPRLDIARRIGLGYAFAGGLMVAASVYNLLMPALVEGTQDATRILPVSQIVIGVLLGCAAIYGIETRLTPDRLQSVWLRSLGSRRATLIFIAMSVHSIPEGVAVGVGFGAETHSESLAGLGLYMAIAIGIHNIPEGLAIALPLRADGASLWKCFWLAVLTSLPQPIAAIPASLLVWFFEPLMLPLLGFAAGAMMYVVVEELLPEAVVRQGRTSAAWAFMTGFCLMVLVQVAL